MAWETLRGDKWPSWVIRAATNDRLHGAWEGNQRLIFYGRTFEYRVTPVVIDQGHWEVGRVERQLRRKK